MCLLEYCHSRKLGLKYAFPFRKVKESGSFHWRPRVLLIFRVSWLKILFYVRKNDLSL